jgi:hypothetical protein
MIKFLANSNRSCSFGDCMIIISRAKRRLERHWSRRELLEQSECRSTVECLVGESGWQVVIELVDIRHAAAQHQDVRIERVDNHG